MYCIYYLVYFPAKGVDRYQNWSFTVKKGSYGFGFKIIYQKRLLIFPSYKREYFIIYECGTRSFPSILLYGEISSFPGIILYFWIGGRSQYSVHMLIFFTLRLICSPAHKSQQLTKKFTKPLTLPRNKEGCIEENRRCGQSPNF
jgi:hypothetical protein